MMRERGPAPVWHLTPLKDISPVLQRMVIIGEDSRFRTHHGIDPSEIADALGADREGGRGFPRALIAAWRLALPKDRILELYLDVAEWGPGIWGADAASRAYFGVPASRLSEEQAAELVATLPHPRTSNPTFRPERTLERRNLILARYHGVEVYIPPEEEDTALVVPPVVLPPIDSLTVQPPTLIDTGSDTTRSQTDST